METQTESKRKLPETRSIQGNGLSFNSQSSIGCLNNYHYFRKYMEREMNQYIRYIKYLREFKFLKAVREPY